ncbi:MAG TPA: hypothetical protein VK881_13560 [bacterium]|nr:hypothetical protein [bacterium]
MSRVRSGLFRLAAVVIVLGLSQLVQAQQSTTPTWTPLTPPGGTTTTGGPAGPSKRLLTSAAYDPATNRMIVFGGTSQDFGNITGYNDVWVLTNADGTGGTPAWIQISPAGTPPAARFGAGVGYDPYDNELIVFGGATSFYNGSCNPIVNPGTLNDVWILTNANGVGGTPTWTQLTVSGAPPSPRRSGVVVYDSSRNRMIIFGGNEACGMHNDTWVLSNANGLETWDTPTWTRLLPPDPLPAVRGESMYSGAYDTPDNMLILFGGQGIGVDYSDVWILTNANGLGGAPVWTQQNPVGGPPMPRHAQFVAYDEQDNALIVIGGVNYNETQFLNDVWWLWNADGLATSQQNWMPLTSSGTSPLPRAGYGAAYRHTTDRRVTIFGGAVCLPCVGVNDSWVFANFDAAILDPPFATFTASDAQINRASRSLQVEGQFTLAAGASINPLTQPVAFGFGGFTALIPAGSFVQTGNGPFRFSGTIDGVPLDVMIKPSNGQSGQTTQSGQTSPQQQGGYAFAVEAAGVPNLPPGNPVTVYLMIGHNSGSGQVIAQPGN